MTEKCFLTAIIASLNEEEGIGPTLRELQQVLRSCRIIVVDGNSVDSTAEIAEGMGASVVAQSGKGKGDAINVGLKHLDEHSRYIIFTDADYTYPAVFIPKMIAILDENPEIGMVNGNRFNSHFHLEGMHDLFYMGNRILATVHNLLNGVDLRDPLTGLRVVRAEVLKGWSPSSRGFDIEVEMNHHVEKKGFRIMEIPILYRERLGEKKLKLKHGAIIFKRIMTEII